MPIYQHGKNLFNPKGDINADKGQYTMNGDATYDANTGILTTTANTASSRGVGQKFTNLAGKTVTFSATLEGVGTSTEGGATINIVKVDNNNNSTQTTKNSYIIGTRIVNTVAIPDNIVKVYATFITRSGSGATFSHIQLEEGSTATTYEPYVEPKIKHIEAPTSGKNLLNISGFTHIGGQMASAVTMNKITLTATGTSGAQYGFSWMRCEPNNQYSFSLKGKKIVPNQDSSNTLTILPRYSSNGTNWTYDWDNQVVVTNPITGQEYNINKTITTGDYTYFGLVFYNASSTPVTVGTQTEYYDIQLEQGSTATTYEPYTNIDHFLPSDYQEVEYIESSGTQYIDTGITTQGTDKIELKFKNTGSISDGTVRAIFGHLALSSDVIQSFMRNNGLATNYTGNTYEGSDYFNIDSWNDLTIERTRVILNEHIVANYQGQLPIASSNNMLLFARYYHGARDYSTIQLSKFLVYKSDSLARNFIPAKAKVASKNLFDKTKPFTDGPSTYSGATTFLQSDGTIKVTANNSYQSSKGIQIDLKKNTNYVLSFNLKELNNTEIFSIRLKVFDGENWQDLKIQNYSILGNGTISFNSGNYDYVVPSFNINKYPRDNTEYAIIDNVQLEEGSTATAYEPYYEAGEVGLYDTVNNRFYTNQGTGDFIAGPNIVSDKIERVYQGNNLVFADRLPDELQECEYVQSSGTQYIDTSVIPTASTTCSLDYEYAVFSGSGPIIGLRKSSTGGLENRLFAIWINGFEGAIALNYSGYDSGFMTYTAINKNKLEIKNKSLYYNGSVIASTENEWINVTMPLYMFCCNVGGVPDRFIAGRLYRCQISDNNSLVRNFIPCYIKPDHTFVDVDGTTQPAGTIGLYDKVNGELYVNAGTGTFTKGRDI